MFFQVNLMFFCKNILILTLQKSKKMVSYTERVDNCTIFEIYENRNHLSGY